ncbi:MAG: aminotransferase class V-fold PLP-dependent enzyme [Geminicoccaceae bacterium]|nr:MAG: aminotransferase class V-fold PLP-dependent enzyme [Geminicoccaceae bacterium]
MAIPSQRHRFDIPPDLAYLNCAYLSPLMDTVMAAGRRGLASKQHPWTITRRDFHLPVEAVRKRFAQLLGATADDVALVASSSYGVATASLNLELARHQNVVLLAEEHASNTYEWVRRARAVEAELRVVPRPADSDWTAAVAEHIDQATAIVALPPVHWTDGTRVDLAAIGILCRKVGAAFVVDATQTMGAIPFDLAAVRPDYLVASAYKWLLCPYTLAFLYVAPQHHNGRPLEQHEFVRAGVLEREGATDWTFDFQPGARRYDMGERSNFIALPMVEAALDQLLEWTPEAIAASLEKLTSSIARRAEAIGWTVPPAAHRTQHMIGIRPPEPAALDLVQKLSARGVEVSLRGGGLRISPHLYNDENDVERLFEALESGG